MAAAGTDLWVVCISPWKWRLARRKAQAASREAMQVQRQFKVERLCVLTTGSEHACSL